MTQQAIQDALEAALDSIWQPLDTVHANESYSPIAGQPYQEVYVLFATPANPTMGDGFYRELGVLQINLQYPTGNGSADAADRAALVRNAFKRGTTVTGNSVTVMIDKTPAVSNGVVDGDRWKVVIKVPWHADIYN